ncbi:Sua5/YciO/YrdC/YwlC family protein [Nocardia sp. CA2R105]|uniref:Sua5/YciO/YrdC/YwlC family protein n=1 Tax=Nocardia coffeae TaxID=2873381 RepID=UPI001CA774BD|nr:Sua5/YciO/YrdC/YwlC family protein [Nocardia coffeae]MBY8860541.1 Sua5/YciO/YrdC/YwlC family protein [Nocardia coffeae]
MTTVTDVALEQVAAALATGSAVVLPNPYPLTSVVAALRAETVNAAKGRPADQPVALWLSDPAVWAEFATSLALDAGMADLARTLLVEERLTALLPINPTAAPDWVRDAARDDCVLVFGSCWSPLDALLTRPLRVSSANRTGHSPVASADEASATFPPDVHILADGDGRPAEGRSATTTVRITNSGVTHTRCGAQDRAHGGPSAYLHHLREVYRSDPATSFSAARHA